MEEMSKQLNRLNDLVLHLNYLSGLVCVLKDGVQGIEMDSRPQYVSACYYISDALIETEAALHQLTEDLFISFRRWKEEEKTAFGL